MVWGASRIFVPWAWCVSVCARWEGWGGGEGWEHGVSEGEGTEKEDWQC